MGGINRANTASVPPHLPGFGPTGWSPPPSPLTGRVGTPTTLHTVMTTGYGASMVPPHRVTTATNPHSYATGRAGPLFPSGTPAPQRANSAMAQLLCQVSPQAVKTNPLASRFVLTFVVPSLFLIHDPFFSHRKRVNSATTLRLTSSVSARLPVSMRLRIAITPMQITTIIATIKRVPMSSARIMLVLASCPSGVRTTMVVRRYI